MMRLSVRVLIGAVVFFAYALLQVPSLLHGAWGGALVLFAALVIAPMVIELLHDSSDDAVTARWLALAGRSQLGAGLCLVGAFALPSGTVAMLVAMPWAAVLLLLAAVGGRRLTGRGWRSAAMSCRDLGALYAAVGAAWLLADRFGLRPLGFDPSIVLLTAVHFHYAGLLLPVLTGLALAKIMPTRRFSLIGAGVMAGVPAVAIGITATQLRLGPAIELVATGLMAFSGFGVAVLHLRLALNGPAPVLVRALWLAAGLSLGAGMSLALLYGMRAFFHPFSWLDLPWMRALHGSLNALGFGFCGVLGWWCCRQKNVRLEPGEKEKPDERH